MKENLLFEFPTYKINKKIRLIELFGGIGTQAMALRDINFINTYKDYVLKFENNRYNLYKGIEHEAD